MRVCSVCHEPVPSGMPVCPRDGGAAMDPKESGDSVIGSMIGEYRVKGVIGEGGMGQVYEGLQPVIGKRVAIKLLRRELASDKTEAQRLLGEARSVNAIGHRGIIDIFSFGALPDGRQYFVMEYLSGVSLSQHLRTHGALPVEDALKLLDEMLAALGAAHGAGVIHRDFKPSNIFLVAQPDGSSFVKLLDFGIAKQAAYARGETPQTRVSRVMGTPEFMAPEQARGQAVGPRTDLYALGVVAFEMLTGEHLFDADNPFEIVNMHLSKAPRPPSALRSEIPPEVDHLVLSLLEKDPQDRPPNAETVRDTIKRIRKALNLNATRLMLAPVSMTQDSLEPLPEVPPTRESEPPPRPSRTRHAPAASRALEDAPPTRILDGRRAGSAPVGTSTSGLDSVTEETNSVVTQPDASEPRRERGLSSRRLAALAASAVGLGFVALGVWALARTPSPVEAPPVEVAAPVEVAEALPPPAPVVEEPELVPPPSPAPVPVEPEAVRPPPVVAKADPPRPKADPLATRYRRVQAAWTRTRASRSPEDRRIFDVMLAEVGKQLNFGARAEAAETLNDFVTGALGGKEP